MFGFEVVTKRTNDRPEAAALAEVLQVLKHHPLVAWCERQNTGAAKVGGRFIRFGWRGCSDLLGMMKDGRLLAVECKAPRGKLRPEQTEFLSLVRRFGGVAFVARNAADTFAALSESTKGNQHRTQPNATERDIESLRRGRSNPGTDWADR